MDSIGRAAIHGASGVRPTTFSYRWLIGLFYRFLLIQGCLLFVCHTFYEICKVNTYVNYMSALYMLLFSGFLLGYQLDIKPFRVVALSLIPSLESEIIRFTILLLVGLYGIGDHEHYQRKAGSVIFTIVGLTGLLFYISQPNATS